MKDTTGIRVAYPDPKGGTSTTGNVARRMLHDKATREQLLSQVPEHQRADLRILVQRFSVVLRVLSSKQKVNNVDTFKAHCADL